MKSAVKICLAMASLTLAVPSWSINVSSVRVLQVNVVDVLGAAHLIVKPEGGVKSTSCEDQTAYVRPLNDEVGKHLMALALTALASGKRVDIVGSSSCGVYNVEVMKEIRIYQ